MMVVADWRREQIAQFVVQNSHGGVSFQAVPRNFDPFTGPGAYVPTAHNAQPKAQDGSGVRSTRAGANADPFTGSGARSDTNAQASFVRVLFCFYGSISP